MFKLGIVSLYIYLVTTIILVLGGENDNFNRTKRTDTELEIPVSRGPYFDSSITRNVTALVGRSAFLYCRVRNLGNRTVSWIRHRDTTLLTVANYTYTSDDRFLTKHSPQTEEWTLQIRFTQMKDSGIYECQIGTNPPIGITMTLTVVEPLTRIVGAPDLHIDYGSTINLTCIVIHSPVPPPSIVWTHNEKEVNYDSPRGGVSVITEKGDNTTSYLLIQRARYSDAGSYKCTPSNADPSSVFVHVMNERPEAMQRGSQLRLESEAEKFIVTTLLILLLQ